jgi:predicted NAD-dependent protein-ADP-ribosyltransferase YbiA (DUF1768 family)
MGRRFLDPTYRVLDDGERIEGTWRHVFIHNGDYFLTDLKIYADGLIDCWGLVTLEEFREKVRSGWVATTLPENGQASAHHLARWEFKNPRIINAEALIKEVVDTVADLQGSPSSSVQFNAALSSFLADRTEESRTALRAAYVEVPQHMRRYLLGDQDMADWPVRVLIGEIGEPLMPRFPPFTPKPITEQDRQRVFRYFEEREFAYKARLEETNDDDPDGPPRGSIDPSVGAGGWKFANGFVDSADDGYLSNDARVTVTVNGIEYPSVTHAYWAESTDDASAKEAIRAAANPRDARERGTRAPRRANWPSARLTVMAELIRLKFRQHPDLARKLVATRSARITAIGSLGRYWDGSGRNWVGRLLELVRSELAFDSTTY